MRNSRRVLAAGHYHRTWSEHGARAQPPAAACLPSEVKTGAPRPLLKPAPFLILQLYLIALPHVARGDAAHIAGTRERKPVLAVAHAQLDRAGWIEFAAQVLRLRVARIE